MDEFNILILYLPSMNNEHTRTQSTTNYGKFQFFQLYTRSVGNYFNC